MRHTHWIKIIREVTPHKSLTEILSHSKLTELHNEDHEIAVLKDSRHEERLPDFDFWFSWN